MPFLKAFSMRRLISSCDPRLSWESEIQPLGVRVWLIVDLPLPGSPVRRRKVIGWVLGVFFWGFLFFLFFLFLPILVFVVLWVGGLGIFGVWVRGGLVV